MNTPLKTPSCCVFQTPTHSSSLTFNVPNYLKSNYGKRINDLDDKVTYLEKLLDLMRLPRLQIQPQMRFHAHLTQPINQVSEKQEKTVKAMHKSEVHDILNSQQILTNLLRLLGIEPKEFQNNYWTMDEAFVFALRDQLNIDRWLEGWKEKMKLLLKPNEFESFYKELEDILFVCVMTIDYLRRFKDKKGSILIENQNMKTTEKSEKVLQVDTIPDYQGIINKLKEQLKENEEEKALLARIFAQKAEGLNKEIEEMEKKVVFLEEKRNEAFELIREGVLEKNLLNEEIENLKMAVKGDEKKEEEEDEETKKRERRKKYALIDDLHARLKVSDKVNKLLAERLEGLFKENEFRLHKKQLH